MGEILKTSKIAKHPEIENGVKTKELRKKERLRNEKEKEKDLVLQSLSRILKSHEIFEILMYLVLHCALLCFKSKIEQ